MAPDDRVHGYGNGSIGTEMPRIMWNRAHRRDRVPDFWPLPALPIMVPSSETDVATIVIVLSEAERAQVELALSDVLPKEKSGNG